ncbi:unknown [Clostridium sp. CAG:448]|nr:unknown [Clostridium sp. CAG:448]
MIDGSYRTHQGKIEDWRHAVGSFRRHGITVNALFRQYFAEFQFTYIARNSCLCDIKTGVAEITNQFILRLNGILIDDVLNTIVSVFLHDDLLGLHY